MVTQKQRLLGSKLYGFLYPGSNYYKLSEKAHGKYEKAAEKFIDYLNTKKDQ